MAKAPTAAQVAQAELQAAAASVQVTTGDIQAKYQPVTIVFAVGGSSGGLFKTGSPQEAFEQAKWALQLAAIKHGGHAVVSCAFGYSLGAKDGCGNSPFIVHGYGTVVKLV